MTLCPHNNKKRIKEVDLNTLIWLVLKFYRNKNSEKTRETIKNCRISVKTIVKRS